LHEKSEKSLPQHLLQLASKTRAKQQNKCVKQQNKSQTTKQAQNKRQTAKQQHHTTTSQRQCPSPAIQLYMN